MLLEKGIFTIHVRAVKESIAVYDIIEIALSGHIRLEIILVVLDVEFRGLWIALFDNWFRYLNLLLLCGLRRLCFIISYEAK